MSPLRRSARRPRGHRVAGAAVPHRARRGADVPDRGVRIRPLPALGADPRMARPSRGVARPAARRGCAQCRRGVPAARPVGIAIAWLVSAAAAQFTWRWTSPKRPLVMTASMRSLLIAGGFLAVAARGRARARHRRAASRRLDHSRAHRRGTGHRPQRDPAGCCQCRHETGRGPDPASLSRARSGARFEEVDPIVVAVVGSYGKTSTKHILAQLLQPNVNTLPTRKSFNTLMGVTRVINEDLTPDDNGLHRGDGRLRAGRDRGDERPRAPAASRSSPRSVRSTWSASGRIERIAGAHVRGRRRAAAGWHDDPLHRRRVGDIARASRADRAASRDPLRAGH